MPNDRPWRGSGRSLGNPRPVVGTVKKKTTPKVERLTTCNVCRYGVFSNQPWVWSTGKVWGRVHTPCKAAIEKEAADA